MYPKMLEIFAYIRANPNLTELEIARGVGLKKTPYSRRILFDLMAEGHIARYPEYPDGRLTYRYYVQETKAMPE